MKKYFGLALFVFALACNSNQAVTEDETALKDKLPASLVNNPRTLNNIDSNKLNALGKLVFEDTIHHFGTLQEGEQVTYDFTFTNKGQKNIIINEAKASCGCTVADYPSHPFKSGDTDKITVTFNSEGKPGMNERAVMITTNGNPSVYNVIIQAEVIPKK